jgi:hypothetical protein
MFPLLDIISPVIGKILDFIPDPQKKAEALAQAQLEADSHQEKIVTAFLASDQAQDAVNAEEAKNPNLFIAGWRPFLGWVCGASFAWVFVVQPIASFVLNAVGHPMTLPTLDLSQMSTVLMGMLGLSGMRTYEKVQGAQGNH